MSFGLYAAGFAIVIAGLVYAAHLVRMPPHWIFCRRDCDDRHWASLGREGYSSERPRLIVRVAPGREETWAAGVATFPGRSCGQ